MDSTLPVRPDSSSRYRLRSSRREIVVHWMKKGYCKESQHDLLAASCSNVHSREAFQCLTRSIDDGSNQAPETKSQICGHCHFSRSGRCYMLLRWHTSNPLSFIARLSPVGFQTFAFCTLAHLTAHLLRNTDIVDARRPSHWPSSIASHFRICASA